MNLTATLTADLHALSAAVDDPDINLADTMVELCDAAAAGVQSYLGLSVAVTGGAHAFQLSTLSDHVEVIGSSVVIPLAAAEAATPGGSGTSLVLYAATPGAFIDMAADLAWITGRDISVFRLDQHLTPPQSAHSVHELSLIDQAIGLMIGRGRTPEQATHDLTLLAAREAADLPAAAASLLDELI